MNRIESGWATVLGYEKVSQISSQKARGIALVSQLGYFSVLNTVIISSQEARKLDSSIMNKEFSESVIDRSFTLDLPILLRTCPVTPRHGILGNKKIVLKRVSELQGACSELAYSMLEYGESEGDIVIQPFVNAAMNLVWTNGHVVIGPDFDGATAGKFPSFGLNVAWHKWLEKSITEHIKGDKHHELEFVIDKSGHVFCTQIRESTEHKDKGLVVLPNSIPGFVPDATSPRLGREYFVIKVKGTDLEILEKLKIENVLVMHQDGNLLSHASAHCRQKGWAYISRILNPKDIENCYICEPAPGSVMFLQKPAGGVNVSVEAYKAQFLDGLQFVLKNKVAPPDHWRAFTLSFAFHHFSTGQSLSPEIAYLAGIFAGVMLKSAFAIILGEMRHFENLVAETDGSVSECWEIFLGAISDSLHLEKETPRNQIYKRVFSTDCSKYLGRILALMRACRILYNKIQWGSGYGGGAWGRVTRATVRSVIALNLGNMKFILREINLLTNAAHNCGWAFNKFTGQQDLLYFMGDFLGNPHWPVGLSMAMSVLRKGIPTLDKDNSTIFVKENVRESLIEIAKLLSKASAIKKVGFKKKAPDVDVSKGFTAAKKPSCYIAVFDKPYSLTGDEVPEFALSGEAKLTSLAKEKDYKTEQLDSNEKQEFCGTVFDLQSCEMFHSMITALLTAPNDVTVEFNPDENSILHCKDFVHDWALAIAESKECTYLDMSVAYELLCESCNVGAKNIKELSKENSNGK